MITVGTFLAPRLEGLYAATAAVAGEALGAEARLVQGSSFDELLDGSLDAAFMCGLPYVGLRERTGADVEPLAAPVPAGERYGGRPVYLSDVVVRAGEGAAGLEDLAGRRWAFNERGSHSGWAVVEATLANRGLPASHFGRVSEVGSHAEALRAVRAGEADAAAIDSHLLDLLRLDDPSIDHDLKVAESLGPSPIQPFVAGPSLTAGDREAVRAGVSAAEPPPGHLVTRWQAVEDAYYDPIRVMLGAARSRMTPNAG